MRIAQLDLLAYGPFRGHTLDLGAPGVHVVFGRNEAGKSTTLRAITGLLYGIETRTQDAHVHKMSELRIGGTLVGPGGVRTRIVRRKGTTNTLLGEDGLPLDEAVLTRLMGGVNEHTFRHAFGLDHLTLAHGAQALLEGKGDIAGSLFDASVGGGGDVRRLLVELQNEAEQIYKARGSTQPLNVALKAFADHQKAIREKEQLPSAYVAQQNALTEQREALAKVAKERAELARRRAQIESARRRVPLERRKSAAEATLAELAAVAGAAARIAGLGAGLGAHERAREARQVTAQKLELLRAKLGDAARHAGVSVAARELRIDVRVQTRIQKLLQERTKLAQRLDTLRIELDRDARELERRRAEQGPGEALDEATLAPLTRALEGARKLGDAQALLAKQRAHAERRRAEVEERAAALGLFEGGTGELRALRPPSAAALEAVAARVGDLDRTLSRHADRLVELDREAHAVEQQLAQAGGEFAPPTRTDLLGARAARDEAWRNVQTARDAGSDASRVEAAFEAAVRDADHVADRMIQEADRVLTLSRHHAQRAAVAAEQAKVRSEHDEAARTRAATLAAHRALWTEAGIGTSAPDLGLADLRAWLARREQILDLLAAVRELEADVAETAAAMAAAAGTLGAALEAL
ncbi:MAG: double-strand break repair Rad50 ATPase, partial [Labilithrix sp.]|nr:double-strand break repair Rad50 ATPase [Labilithrix sp.]